MNNPSNQIRKRVRDILENFEETRTDDGKLVTRYWNHFYMFESFHEFLLLYSKGKVVKGETITRYARTWRNKNKEKCDQQKLKERRDKIPKVIMDQKA